MEKISDYEMSIRKTKKSEKCSLCGFRRKEYRMETSKESHGKITRQNKTH